MLFCLHWMLTQIYVILSALMTTKNSQWQMIKDGDLRVCFTDLSLGMLVCCMIYKYFFSDIDPCGRNPCRNTEICHLTSSISYLCLDSREMTIFFLTYTTLGNVTTQIFCIFILLRSIYLGIYVHSKSL